MKTQNSLAPHIGVNFALELAFPVSVKQDRKNSYTVRYGLETHAGLSYEQAARQFGLCVFHALACDGRISPSE